jgi:glycosyltransferase involved in cell wall biosynthesis
MTIFSLWSEKKARAMQNPIVSFVIPCYKLAHLLPDCVNSILSQSYGDFEILIMDDCSPDNTAEVVRSFEDGRIRYIRNDPNLGHLHNYNKGIAMSRGKYVWLISADDYLRCTYVLERYLEVLNRNPSVGYACCPAVGLKDGRETGILEWSVFPGKDRVIRGHEFLKKLVKSNCVPAPSGLVRRDCYDALGAFPLDMPYSGDWYLWCLFALYFDVAYFAEPMVYYRQHDLNITNALMAESVQKRCEEVLSIPWIIKQKAEDEEAYSVSRACTYALGYNFGHSMSSRRYFDCESIMTRDQFESSLDRYTCTEEERIIIRSVAFATMADEYYSRGDTLAAQRYYQASLNYTPWNAMVRIKKFLLYFGKLGESSRKALRSAHKRGIFGSSL